MERPLGATPDRSAGPAVASRDEGSRARTLLACVVRTADQIGVDGLQKGSQPNGLRRRRRLSAKRKSPGRQWRAVLDHLAVLYVVQERLSVLSSHL